MAREGHLCVELTPQLDPRFLEGASLLPTSLFVDYLSREKNRIYLRRNWECEYRFLTHMKRFKSQLPSYTLPLTWLEAELDKEQLNFEQKRAILKAAKGSLTLITGGPGTGKTYTAATLIRLFSEGGLKEIAVAAPTGKATANLRASLGLIAEKCTIKTLHSLLKSEWLYADLILVDESSMIDAELMAKLFSAVKPGARLVLLGDKDQLPPIESGNFFADLAQDQHLVSELKTCLRIELQEIIDLASQVKNGIPITAHPLPNLKELVGQIVHERIDVLTPLRKGPYGVDHLNKLLYVEHQKRGAKEIPIIITVNDAYLELFNGDTGLLNQEERIAYFSDGRQFAEHLLPHYEYAYVLSVHKSQGSEYEKVLILLPEGSEVFGREMLYTAITRAKKQMTLLAHEGVVEKVVKGHYTRFSGVVA